MISDSSQGSAGTSARLRGAHSDCPWALLCQRVFEFLPSDVFFEILYFPLAMTIVDVIWSARASFP